MSDYNTIQNLVNATGGFKLYYNLLNPQLRCDKTFIHNRFHFSVKLSAPNKQEIGTCNS